MMICLILKAAAPRTPGAQPHMPGDANARRSSGARAPFHPITNLEGATA